MSLPHHAKLNGELVVIIIYALAVRTSALSNKSYTHIMLISMDDGKEIKRRVVKY